MFHKWLRRLIVVSVLAAALMGESPASAITPEGDRIGWNVDTMQTVRGGGFGGSDSAIHPTLLRVSDSLLLCVYRYKSGSTYSIRISKSTKDASGNWSSWSEQGVAATSSTTMITNPHMILLPPDPAHDNKKPILLALREGESSTEPDIRWLQFYKSWDDGATWTKVGEFGGDKHYAEPFLLYKSTTDEVLAFYATEALPIQNIAMRRSYDKGATWTATEEIVSSNANSRDGMPSAVFLDPVQEDEMMVVFEATDHRSSPDLNPFVVKYVKTASVSNVQGGAITWGARSIVYNPSATTKRAAAPWLVRATGTGELIVSFQTNENASRTADESDVEMKVIMSSDNGATWSRKHTPFLQPVTDRAVWNSVYMLDSKTVVAAASIETSYADAASREQAIIKMGELNKSPMEAVKATASVPAPIIDGGIADPIWAYANNPHKQFVGADKTNTAEFRVAWDSSYLYYYGHVWDKVFKNDSADPAHDDSVAIMLDKNHNHGSAPDTDDYKIVIDIGGTSTYYQGTGTAWAEWTPAAASQVTKAVALIGTMNNDADVDERYKIEAAIPWSHLGYASAPPAGTTLGISFIVHDDDDGGGRDSIETISGNVFDNPYNWCDVTLMP